MSHKPFRKGTKVRESAPPVEGVVTDAQYDSETGRFRYCVDYVTDGEQHRRWFDQDELNEVKEGV